MDSVRMVRAVVGALLCTAFAVPAMATAADPATMVGERYDDGLDSRLSAQHLAQAASAVGYAAATHASGRPAQAAWSDGLDATVYGLFGHANAGLFQTDETASDEFLAAGLFGAGGYGSNVRLWSDYLPFVDVDDMKLAILAGCYTANSDPDLGSFPQQGRELGIDSVVGFTGLVYYPANCTSCNYSGSLFWDRFSVYAGGGASVGTALSKAAADLRASEGDPGGWDSWYVGGAADFPAGVRLTPAGSGEPLNAKPFGIDPFDPLALSMTSSRSVTVDGRSYTDQETAEGVSLRREQESGDLVWLSAPVSTQGDEQLSADAARKQAVEFAESFVRWFEASSFVLTSQEDVSHIEGDSIERFTWRSRTPDGRPGPGAVTVELDRRTGAVVDFSAARVSPQHTAGTIDQATAVEAAMQTVRGEGRVTTVAQDVWERQRWTVTIEGAPGRTPDTARVVVDGRTGEVISVSRS